MSGLASILAAVVLHFTPTGYQPPSVSCLPSQSFWAEINQPPIKAWPGGVAGAIRGQDIYLTDQECANLQALENGEAYTWQRGYSVLVLTHELGHLNNGPDEAAADCFGAEHASTVAYLLGVRVRSVFAQLSGAEIRRAWGYAPVPEECWP